jgi:hypothetical protein
MKSIGSERRIITRREKTVPIAQVYGCIVRILRAKTALRMTTNSGHDSE